MSISDYKPIGLSTNINYINGLELFNSTTNPDEIVSARVGTCMDSTNTFQINVTSTISANNTVSGAGGIDTGTVAASTGYFIHVIADLQGINSPSLLLSTSATAPVMPYGYAIFRNIGWIRTASDSDFLPGYWSGYSSNRLFMFDAPLATTITAGASTTAAEVPLSGLVPANILNMPVIMYADLTPAAASRTLSVRPYGATGYPIVITSQVTSVHVTTTFRVQSRLNSTTPSLQYIWSAGGGDAVAFSVAGFEYYL